MPRRRFVGVVALVLVGVVLAGPRPRVDDAWVEPALPDDLDAWLAREEATIPNLRPGDEKGIVWADSLSREPTALSIVYLHGYSADRHEIEPVVSDLGRALHANVFFTRLAGHGRGGAGMAEASADDWLHDAAEAVAIGGRLGDRVVVIGTSTGGTLATWIAARAEARERVAGVILVSPNFQPRDRSSRILLYPWGGLIARLVVGPERCFRPANEQQARHWTACYPTSALLPMMALVEHVRTMDLSRVDMPVLVFYSQEDSVVDPAETERVLSTMTAATVEVERVATGDGSHHVLAGDIVSPQSNGVVESRMADFMRHLVGDTRPSNDQGAAGR